MKKGYTLVILSAAALFFANCTAKKAATTTPPVAAAPATPAPPAAPAFTAAQLEEGKTIWENKCIKCHKLYSPDSRTVSGWDHILPSMNAKSKLNVDQAALVRAYLVANARK